MPLSNTVASIASSTLPYPHADMAWSGLIRPQPLPWPSHDGDGTQAIVSMLVHLASIADGDTGGHLRRVHEYVAALVAVIRDDGRYAGVITDAWVSDLLRAAPLHDVGKIGIPDQILNNPGRLTVEEMKVMRSHCGIGHNIICESQKQFSWVAAAQGPRPISGSKPESNFWAIAKAVVLLHHERWDGSGYPFGLAGEKIPLAARLMALADVFDALSSPRVYRAASPVDEVIRHIIDRSGTDFDPTLVDAFIKALPSFRKIAATFASS